MVDRAILPRIRPNARGIRAIQGTGGGMGGMEVKWKFSTLYPLPAFLLNINGSAPQYKIAFVVIFALSYPPPALRPVSSPLRRCPLVAGTDENGSEGKLAVKTSPC